MSQRRWRFALTLVSSLTLGLTAQEPPPVPVPVPSAEAPTVPGGEVVKVAEHFSKWEYPKEVTVPAGSSLYLVVKGDTLWDLGQRFLGNPFAWPQIWEQNKWIRDPHWIYPGDPLVVPVDKKVIASATQPGEPSADVAGLRPDRLRGLRRSVAEEYGYTFQDFIQQPYLAPAGLEAHLKEVGAVRITERKAEERSFLGDGETIYLSGGANRGLKVGDRMVILKLVQKDLKHPSQPGTNLGDVLQQIGVLRITQVNPSGSVAVIEKCMDTVEMGFYAIPFTEPANIVAKLRPVNEDEPVVPQAPTAEIVFCRDAHEHAALGEMMIMDRGTRDGYKVGDVLLVFRRKTWPVDGPAGADAESREETCYYVGQVLVVRAEDSSSTCRVLRTLQEIRPGDLLTK